MWKMYEAVFELESPVHIGYLPSKGNVVSLTRRYVPGKNFWGAVTKRATELLYENPTGKEYQDIGNQIRENFRFSYFYIFHENKVYYPYYSEEGLIYQNMSSYEFDLRFIGSRAVTAINSETGTAKDESLHEIEFIKHVHKDRKGEIKKTYIIGLIWVKESAELTLNGQNKQRGQICINEGNTEAEKKKDLGIFINDNNIIEELTLGGEQNYGFGRVKLCKLFGVKSDSKEKDNPEVTEKILPINTYCNGDEVIIIVEKDKPILSHVEINNNVLDKIGYFKGNIELIRGMEYETSSKKERFHGPGAKVIVPKYYFAPGTFFGSGLNFKLDYDGKLKILDN